MKSIIIIWMGLLGIGGLEAQNLTQNQNQKGNDSLMVARMELARSYIHGVGTKMQPEKAMGLFTQCADAGNAEAMNALGMIYKNGLVGAKDSAKAMQWFAKAANAGYRNAWYNLGNAYKDAMDFVNAYNSYCKAADLGETHSIFLKGYMLYKGLGCTQDYEKAAALFAQGAAMDKANSMYFLGLCYRNGYGVAVDVDKARYWLARAATKGNGHAKEELMEKLPENVELAGTLTDKIQAAQAAMPNKSVVNQYTKVEQQLTISDVAGTYQGYLLKYDWSGKHVIEANKLEVTLGYSNDSLKGVWKEDDSITLPIQALFTPKALVFNKVQYNKTSHYRQTRAETIVFQNASLQLTNADSGVYLSGNIQAFTPRNKEPQRPLYLALERRAGNVKGNMPIKPLKAYPNPFDGTITMDFELKEACKVVTELFTIDGKLVYSNPAGVLSAGSYTLPIKTQQVAAGQYILVLHCGDNISRAKVMKF